MLRRSLFFDKHDYELLSMINKTLDHVDYLDRQKKIFDANLHPHGVVRLATSPEYRMAQAVINLLDSLQTSSSEDRLMALEALRDEVLHSARTSFRYNTGRVLIQLMKDIVRSRGTPLKQLRLVHDFRRVLLGNARIVRSFLKKQFLIEMPEECNQLTLDHHVHDANTKGRKNPTHLIMDAWVKGVRFLTVVYYNYVDKEVAKELLTAAEIMDINVRIALEFQVPFYDRFIRLTWAPRGFSDTDSFLAFMQESDVAKLMLKGREVSMWKQRHVVQSLHHWNTKHAPSIARELGISLPLLQEEKFLRYVGAGQASYMHLAEFAYKELVPLLEERIVEIADLFLDANSEEQKELDALLQVCHGLSVEKIGETWIEPSCNPELPSPYVPSCDSTIPEILRMSPRELLHHLSSLRSSYRATLQLAHLSATDVLEILWDCKGLITHLELFNLKEWYHGHCKDLEAISLMQQNLNNGSAPRMKFILRQMITQFEQNGEKDSQRCEKFRNILHNISALQNMYKEMPLRSRLGTDSTSNANMRHGMGLAVINTLPMRGQSAIREIQKQSGIVVPIHLHVVRCDCYSDNLPQRGFWPSCVRLLRHVPFLSDLSMQKSREWSSPSSDAYYTNGQTNTNNANIGTMGGIKPDIAKENTLERAEKQEEKFSAIDHLSYLNKHVANGLKLLIGFIPAMLAFWATQSFWFLAYGGAIIWFLITGVRNIVQAILAGGTLRRPSLLRWKHHIDWGRICDSLMYTGLSVVLLEWGMRKMLLGELLGLSVENAPTLVFTSISVANGLYISGHNLFRGLPKEAIIGNAFRSVLAIPLAMLYFDGLFAAFLFMGVADPLSFMVPSTAIISKAASDTVAGLIEGIAERKVNWRLRSLDYQAKIQAVFANFTRLELAFPDEDMLSLFAKPKKYIHIVCAEQRQLYLASIINALDLMYFWYYLPYAQQRLAKFVAKMSPEERLVFARSQHVLVRVREVSQLYVDGLVGKNFSKALSFYLEKSQEYLQSVNRLCNENLGSKN